MMAVLQKYPKHIRSLILDSPLPEFVNIDEQELANFNEVLTPLLGRDGRQERYIKAYFDEVFSGSGSISGMRLSVYCSDKMAFEQFLDKPCEHLHGKQEIEAY
jgi:hypothetical protein